MTAQQVEVLQLQVRLKLVEPALAQEPVLEQEPVAFAADNLRFVVLLPPVVADIEPVEGKLLQEPVDMLQVPVAKAVPDNIQEPELLQVLTVQAWDNRLEPADSYKLVHSPEHIAVDTSVEAEPCPEFLPMDYEYRFLQHCNLAVGVVHNLHLAPDISAASLVLDS